MPTSKPFHSVSGAVALTRLSAVETGVDSFVPSSVVDGVVTSDEDTRKLRSAIKSIFRDQEDLRMSVPVTSKNTLTTLFSMVSLASLASLTAVVPLALRSTLVPALLCGIFLRASAAESSGTRSKGIARYHSAQAVALAAQQETVLANAEVQKAFLPFCVGFTAIFAALCVTIKVFSETSEGIVADHLYVDVLFVFFSVLSVVGAVISSDRSLQMYTALTLRPEERAQDDFGESEWEARRLPKIAREPNAFERVLVAIVALVTCFLPWLCLMPSDVTEVAILASATAAALAAIVCLIAEKTFADAERRIAIQMKQANLAELFLSQSQAEAAVMPVGSAMAAASVSGAATAVEFSFAAAAAAATPWPAVVGALKSSLAEGMTRVEADATWLERQLSARGRGVPISDVITSAFREIQRFKSDFLERDPFSDDVRRCLLQLPLGGSSDFRGLPREKRRKVHLMAAELGMASQSIGSVFNRVVSVTRVAAGDGRPKESDSLGSVANELVNGFFSELRAASAQGMPQDPNLRALLAGAGLVACVGAASPLLVSREEAELVLPLATGTVGLLTVWQEKEGKEAVGVAKRICANTLQSQAQSETLYGQAVMAYAAMPVAFAAVTFIAAAAAACAEVRQVAAIRCALVPLLVFACVMRALAVKRLGRVKRNIDSALRVVGGTRLRASEEVARLPWWLAPLLVAAAMPCAGPTRAAAACAIIAADVGCMMASASRQLANGSRYIARSGNTVARADAWAQQASVAIRRLPFVSAAAIVTTLLSTAVVTLSLPTGAVFPVLGLGFCFRALQFGTEAGVDAAEVEVACASPQDLSRAGPWTGRDMASDQNAHEALVTEHSAADLIAREVSRPGVPSHVGDRARKTDDSKRGNPLRTSVYTSYLRLMRLVEEDSPDKEYASSPADRAVRSVQDELDELRTSARTNERNFIRALAAVGFTALVASVVPLFLSASATELVLPVAGSGLTLFAAAAESGARGAVASAKVRSAELRSVLSLQEEYLAFALLHRAQLFRAAALSCGLAALAIAAHGPWPPWCAALQLGFRVALTGAGIAASAWCVRPLRRVLMWSERLQATTLASIRVDTLPNEVDAEAMQSRRATWMSLLAALVPGLLAVLPAGRHFARRAVASTAAGSFVLALALLVAERSIARAEYYVAACMRTYALTDAFSNEAEHQGALLPVASAASIAISGLITFGAELNPVAASALAVLQVVAWVIASRKANAAKFESAAARQVDFVSEPVRDTPSVQFAESDNMQRWIKGSLLSVV